MKKIYFLISTTIIIFFNKNNTNFFNHFYNIKKVFENDMRQRILIAATRINIVSPKTL